MVADPAVGGRFGGTGFGGFAGWFDFAAWESGVVMGRRGGEGTKF